MDPEPILPQPESIAPSSTTPSAGKFNPILILAAVILLVVVGAGGILLGRSLNNPKSSAQPTAAPLPTQIPTFTPDPTANWKTYLNEKFSYSFKYPASFQYLANHPGNNGVYLAPSEGTGEGKGTPFGLDPAKDSWISADAGPLDDAGLKYWQNKFSGLNSNVSLGGLNGYKEQYLPGEGTEAAYGYGVMAIKGNIFYKIDLLSPSKNVGLSPENEKLFDQILSTFKFTSP